MNTYSIQSIHSFIQRPNEPLGFSICHIWKTTLGIGRLIKLFPSDIQTQLKERESNDYHVFNNHFPKSCYALTYRLIFMFTWFVWQSISIIHNTYIMRTPCYLIATMATTKKRLGTIICLSIFGDCHYDRSMLHVSISNIHPSGIHSNQSIHFGGSTN